MNSYVCIKYVLILGGWLGLALYIERTKGLSLSLYFDKIYKIGFLDNTIAKIIRREGPFLFVVETLLLETKKIKDTNYKKNDSIGRVSAYEIFSKLKKGKHFCELDKDVQYTKQKISNITYITHIPK